ncbi:MAG: glycogen/starch synthase [Mucinivorans sp.]
MKSKKILYICSEVTPYTEETPLATVCRTLPQLMQENDNQIRIFMPRYGSINERRGQLHEVIRLSGMNLIIGNSDHQLIIKVASIAGARVQVYFIDNEDYFSRRAMIQDADGKYFDDNDERAVFFNRGVLETVKKLRWAPDIIHCHGWISAIAPIYLRKVFASDPIFNKSKIVISLYDDDFEGQLAHDFKDKLRKEGVKAADLAGLEEPTYVKLMSHILPYADGIIRGSKTINPELEKLYLSSDKPRMEATEETINAENYNQFYEEILSR